MGLFSQKKFAALNRFFSRLPGFSKPDKYSLSFLNVAQFCGVLNDNIFKLVIAFMLIDILGKEHASNILSMAGAIFVLPFIFFSSSAGIIADRFSKQRLLVAMKAAEILIMILAIAAFTFKSVWGSYTLLFLLSTHSAMFGPSKYAIISELVPSDKVSRANGLITAFTYLGVIGGTFLASFVTDLSHRHFASVAAFCLLIACIGFISTFGIKYTPPQGSKKKINPWFFSEIAETLAFCKPRENLLIAIIGSAYFLFVGSFTQMNIIPFALNSLQLSEIAGGYLFLSTALGIAIGSFIAGKVSKKRVELGLPCLAGVGIGMMHLFIALFSESLTLVILFLVLLGIFGGLFVVPFESYVQLFSPSEKRGQIIASNNFLSFCGVLIAAGALFFYSDILNVSPATGFALTGAFSLFLSFILIARLSEFSLPFFSRCFIKPFMRLRTVNLELLDKHPNTILVLQNASWLKIFLLLSIAPKTHLLLPQLEKRRISWVSLFNSIHPISTDSTLKPILEAAKALSSDSIHPCIVISEPELPETPHSESFFSSLLNPTSLIYVDISFSSPGTLITFSKK